MPVILQISDIHLGRIAEHDAARGQVVRRAIANVRPDLVVVSGDVCENPIGSPEEVEAAKGWLDALGADYIVAPGNHDIGNKVTVSKHVLTRGLFEHWAKHFGRGWSRRDLDGWAVLTLNSQLTSSGWPEEDEQLNWLEAQLDAADRAAVFMHMPLDLEPAGPDTSNYLYWPVDPAPRARLLPLLSQPKVRVLATGHLHNYAHLPDAIPPRVWCPSVTFQVDIAGVSDTFADPDVLGVLRHDLDGDEARHEYIPLDIPGVTRSVG